MIGLLCTTPAVAQVATQLAARRLLIDRARVAQRAGDHATALELASSALRIRSTASLLLFIAEELVGLGREVEALGNVERCLLAAQTERGVPAVAQNCRLLQARLRSRVVGLTTRCVPESVQISIDGGEPTACGVTALSPGSHQVEARAVGYVSRAIVLVLAGGETRSESIALEPLPPDEPPPLPPPPAASAPVATAALQVRPPAPRPSPSAARRRPPLVGPMRRAGCPAWYRQPRCCSSRATSWRRGAAERPTTRWRARTMPRSPTPPWRTTDCTRWPSRRRRQAAPLSSARSFGAGAAACNPS
nr:hypothetical protein [Deltaproteobacteria bacterium]